MAIATDQDIIVAVATPPGRGGIGIVRLSGPDLSEITRTLLGECPPPRRARLTEFLGAGNQSIDEGIVLYFKAPHSLTGQDVLELQGHGGPVVLDMLLERACQLGARHALPGEFSQRAFLNDKLDLAQAEAIADLIDAGSVQAARAALRSLKGEFSDEVHSLTEALIELRAYVEAAIDFPEEEVDFLSHSEVFDRLERLFELFEQIQCAARQGSLLREGMNLVIAGRPNAGKSSLLNRLAGYEAAIVTEVPGTTRDVLRERIHIDGMPLHIIDTAGLRSSGDIVEREGVRRAHDEMQRADRVLLVVDIADTEQGQTESVIKELPGQLPVTIVNNKVDLTADAPQIKDTETPEIFLSAKTGAGLDLLREHLRTCMGYQSAETGALIARRRHLDALARALAHTKTAKEHLVEAHAGELMAEELRLAQQALGEITGEFTTEDLLGRIFSSFCIGK